MLRRIADPLNPAWRPRHPDMKKILALLALAPLFGLGLFAATADAELPPLQNGDIVFQNTTNAAQQAIMLASGTEYTHMGIVEIDKKGRAQVIEAVGPVRVVPLDKWIGNGSGGRVTVKRVRDLDEGDAKQALERARYYLGRPYDHYFYEMRDQIYCSELVYAAFKEGPDIDVGTVERMGDLNIRTPAARKLIQQRWKSHPLCKAQGARTFDACYELILEQTVVTPASIARDPKLELVYSNFGFGAE